MKSTDRATNLTAFTKVVSSQGCELFAARLPISCPRHFLFAGGLDHVVAPIIKHPLRARRHADNAFIVSWIRGKPATSINFSHTCPYSQPRPSSSPIVVETLLEVVEVKALHNGLATFQVSTYRPLPLGLFIPIFGREREFEKFFRNFQLPLKRKFKSSYFRNFTIFHPSKKYPLNVRRFMDLRSPPFSRLL